MMDKHKKKKLIIFTLILLTTLMLVGITLYAIGQGISSSPLMLAGLVVAGISFIPLLIISIILYFKQGSIY